MCAEHPIVTLSTCGTSIVYLLAEFEPLTMAHTNWWTVLESNQGSRIFSPAHRPRMSTVHMYWRGESDLN